MIEPTIRANKADLSNDLPHHIREPAALRGFGEQLPDAEVGKHHIGRSVQRFIIGPFKAVAFDRRMEQVIDFPNEMLDVFVGDVTALIFKQVIDTNEEIGNRVEPRKPGILLKQCEERIDGFNRPVDAFIRQLLGHNQGPVKSDQAFTDREHRAPANVDGNERCRLGRCRHMSSVAGQ